jgi:DNA-binding NtrC family response regulator
MASAFVVCRESALSGWRPEDILRRAAVQGGGAVLDAVLDHIVAAYRADFALFVRAPSGVAPFLRGRRAGALRLEEPRVRLRPLALRELLALRRGQFWDPGVSGVERWCLGVPISVRETVDGALFVEGEPPSPFPCGRSPSDEARSLSSLVTIAVLFEESHHRNDAGGAARRHELPVNATEKERPEGGEDFADLFPEIVGQSPAVRSVLHSVTALARSDIPVVIEGESGTGKELVARAIHRLSRRVDAPFVSENCGAIPEHLVEAVIFGHEKGAFTGADASRPGLFERAHSGTLFLDEVGEMDLGLQKKFLRVLQERDVRRVGGSSSRPVDFRVISATNRKLEEMVARGLFREDLFYRLHVASVRLPPLRERAEDIPLLIEHFARKYALELSRPPLELSEAATAFLCEYRWPGNVRELEGEVWRLSTTVRGPVEVEDLARRITHPTEGAGRSPVASHLDPDGRSLDEIEREALGNVIAGVLERTGGNVARAARVLGIARATLYRRIERYGICYRGGLVASDASRSRRSAATVRR